LVGRGAGKGADVIRFVDEETQEGARHALHRDRRRRGGVIAFLELSE
jgi:hypothetical protein